MPRVLNVEKLRMKFASLTKSRESIQTLSSWIIHHKTFYQDITQEWLKALENNFNLLNLFYVANDVIQHCGRKGAPEFKTAFAAVLAKAVELESVRKIKDDVYRMVTIWNKRDIYDSDFTKRLQEILYAEDQKSDASGDSDDLTESDIISRFKLQDLLTVLERATNTDKLLQKKQVDVDLLEEPEVPSYDNLIVRMESHKVLKQLESFCLCIEEYINLSNNVNALRKKAIREVTFASAFYTSQMDEVKKVVHAYRIYDKKVRNLEKKLTEKIAEFIVEVPASDSPYEPESEWVPMIETTGISDVTKNNIPECPSIQLTLPATEPTNDDDDDIVDDFENEPTVEIDTEKSDNIEAESISYVTSPVEVEEKREEETETKNIPRESLVDEVDSILEENYHQKHSSKSRSNTKRKLESWLEAREQKHKKIKNRGESSSTELPLKTSDTISPQNIVTSPDEVAMIEEDLVMPHSETINAADVVKQSLLVEDSKASSSSSASSSGFKFPDGNETQPTNANQDTNIAALCNVSTELLRTILDSNKLGTILKSLTVKQEQQPPSAVPIVEKKAEILAANVSSAVENQIADSESIPKGNSEIESERMIEDTSDASNVIESDNDKTEARPDTFASDLEAAPVIADISAGPKNEQHKLLTALGNLAKCLAKPKVHSSTKPKKANSETPVLPDCNTFLVNTLKLLWVLQPKQNSCTNLSNATSKLESPGPQTADSSALPKTDEKVSSPPKSETTSSHANGVESHDIPEKGNDDFEMMDMDVDSDEENT